MSPLLFTIVAANAGPYSYRAVATLGFWALALTTAGTAVVIGVVEGRERRRFAHGRWISVSLVGLCAPWTLFAYVLGNGMGRLLPIPGARLGERGWQEAVRLYTHLASGYQPPVVHAPDVGAGSAVYMDVPFNYARFYAADVAYRPGSMVAVGPPGFVAGAAIGRLIGTTIGYARAAGLSQRRWRGHRPARVVVTATTTWCKVSGRWLGFDHDRVMEYRIGVDQSCILAFRDVAPVRLHGPSAWCHAVLFAYLRYGPRSWQNAAFLRPVRLAAQRVAAVR
ncbi:hypothetical protein [Phytohabitans aurantiacus]|uniref:hypothetical protein n=1 Tax=Phytohabitans aurantiacus TaxID=3016789 RepID=UPI002492AECB|nr:hypothetical protein [Phytohabitans aurantiacus]